VFVNANAHGVRMVALSDYDLKIAKKKKKLSSVNAE
jgi:hypothetical protein